MILQAELYVPQVVHGHLSGHGMLAVRTYVQFHAVTDTVGHTIPRLYAHIGAQQVCHLPHKQHGGTMGKTAYLGLLVGAEQCHGLNLPLVEDKGLVVESVHADGDKSTSVCGT